MLPLLLLVTLCCYFCPGLSVVPDVPCSVSEVLSAVIVPGVPAVASLLLLATLLLLASLLLIISLLILVFPLVSPFLESLLH